ncbi:MAG TPA: BTAD domain-containing putative transcriptional regulator, partial [Geminicoccaceae bacterium]|nr:BTAD domain-containing putative transcriptional regulator [Geminicoccaceae bacterium]
MTQLRISLFGGARCVWQGEERPLRLGRPGQLLLGFLALNRGRTHSRDRLAELLWGEEAGEHSRQRLNTALWRLRQSLAPPGSATPRHAAAELMTGTAAGEVGLGAGPHCWVDVEAFTAAVRAATRESPARAAPATAAALESGLDLYAGELMAGLDEDWLELERRHLAELQQAALEWLLRHRAASGRAEAAVEAARRLLRQDPLREDVHRELMLLHEALGQRGQALRQYDYCRDVLASELGVTPMPETEALHRRLLQASPRPGAAGTTALPTDRALLVAMLG